MGFTRAFLMLHNRNKIVRNYQFIVYIDMSEDASSITVICAAAGYPGRWLCKTA